MRLLAYIDRYVDINMSVPVTGLLLVQRVVVIGVWSVSRRDGVQFCCWCLEVVVVALALVEMRVSNLA